MDNNALKIKPASRLIVWNPFREEHAFVFPETGLRLPMAQTQGWLEENTLTQALTSPRRWAREEYTEAGKRGEEMDKCGTWKSQAPYFSGGHAHNGHTSPSPPGFSRTRAINTAASAWRPFSQRGNKRGWVA